MLQTLKIENVALIDKATLNFDEKLNVISGETGAGKSIMLDSLSFVFGGRGDRSLIRSGTNSMKVEAIFSALSENHVNFIKNELNIDCGDELFLSRELDLNGRNTCKINGELVPVASVKKICQLLVDIHGQSEHLSILNNDYQLQIIDLFSKESELVLKDLQIEIEKYKENEKEIHSLGGNEQEKQNLIDLYSYQIQEIENANILPNEYEELSSEKKEMSQFEKINESLTQFLQSSDKNSFAETAVDKLIQAKKCLQSIADLNEHYTEILNRVNSVLIELEDINETVLDNLNKNVFNQDRFDYVDTRLDYIKTMFRKYGGNYEKFNDYFLNIKEKLDCLLNSEEKYKELTAKKENILKNIDKIQNKLHLIRKNAAEKLKIEMQKELQTLGMPNARLDIEFFKIDEPFSSSGFDRVEYMFSSNLGFELKPLNKVVSGGEMSRVMLAYKIVVSTIDNIHTIVFDEVDTGLSGNIATIVAGYMARLSCNKQIIAVSHLPQICAMADCNIKVEKYNDNVTTHTKSTILSGENLYLEIARLMGAEADKIGLETSKNLKIKCDEYKQKIRKT